MTILIAPHPQTQRKPDSRTFPLLRHYDGPALSESSSLPTHSLTRSTPGRATVAAGEAILRQLTLTQNWTQEFHKQRDSAKAQYRKILSDLLVTSTLTGPYHLARGHIRHLFLLPNLGIRGWLVTFLDFHVTNADIE